MSAQPLPSLDAAPAADHRAVLARRAFMALFAVLLVMAVIGVASPVDRTGAAPGTGVQLVLGTHGHARGRVTIRINAPVTAPRVLLSPAVRPAAVRPRPATMAHRAGRLELRYGALVPGDVIRLRLAPRRAGARGYAVALLDGRRRLAQGRGILARAR
jgi:hypothetical protein